LTTTDPHAGQQILRLGPVPEAARLTVICIHGRGAAADDMLGLARELQIADVAFLAPQAANNTWYPYSFLTPIEKNEPWLTSALTAVDRLVAALGAQGVTGDRVALMGFSQGACLTLEFSARNPRRYAAVIALSGGLIGPPGTSFDYSGSLAETPVFIGCSDVDAHIPVERVRESAEVMRTLGARVDERIYPRMGHTVNSDELAAVRSLLGAGPARAT
jgi:predicted esterase